MYKDEKINNKRHSSVILLNKVVNMRTTAKQENNLIYIKIKQKIFY